MEERVIPTPKHVCVRTVLLDALSALGVRCDPRRHAGHFALRNEQLRVPFTHVTDRRRALPALFFSLPATGMCTARNFLLPF